MLTQGSADQDMWRRCVDQVNSQFKQTYQDTESHVFSLLETGRKIRMLNNPI